MGEIVASVQRVTDIIGEITAAASEQATASAVNTAVTQLDQMTQQNAALVEQSAAAAESLKDQAQRLARSSAPSAWKRSPEDFHGPASENTMDDHRRPTRGPAQRRASHHARGVPHLPPRRRGGIDILRVQEIRSYDGSPPASPTPRLHQAWSTCAASSAPSSTCA